MKMFCKNENDEKKILRTEPALAFDILASVSYFHSQRYKQHRFLEKKSQYVNFRRWFMKILSYIKFRENSFFFFFIFIS